MDTIKGCFAVCFFGLFFLAFGPLQLAVGGYALFRAGSLYMHGERVEGEVVDVVEDTETIHYDDRVEHVTVYCPVVRFTMPDGSRSHEEETDCGEPRSSVPDIGESVPIVLEAGEPGTARRGTFQSVIGGQVLAGIVAFVFGIGTLVAAVVLFLNGTLARWLGGE